MIRYFGMILSAIIGLILRENTNPFLQVNKKQKLSNFLKIAFIIAILSFIFTLDLILCVWYLINNNHVISKPRSVIMNLIISIMGVITFGITTFLPFFL